MGKKRIPLVDDIGEMETAAEEFESWYSELQSAFQVTHVKDLTHMVSGVGNRLLPVHRWYNLKEAFSADLPLWVTDRLNDHYNYPINRVIDPFIGGGTTGVSLAQQGISVCGIEYNPFIHFVAKTKSSLSVQRSSLICQTISKVVLSEPRVSIEIPKLQTFTNPEYFDARDIQVMLHVIEQIRDLPEDEATCDFLLLGVAAAIDDVANLRKDGRALRYSPKPSKVTAEMAIRRRWQEMVLDLSDVKYRAAFDVFSGTAVDLDPTCLPSSFHLAFSSPPYLNNFDYSEIYKLELWLLGYVDSVNAWRALRKSTIRSHPSVLYERTDFLRNDPRTEHIAEYLAKMENSICLADERTQQDMRGVISGYFEDMYLAFAQQWEVLEPGGYLVYVVANSRHKWLPIATDVILGEIARGIGFEPLELVIFRQRNGRTRQKAFLRETVTFMRKPV